MVHIERNRILLEKARWCDTFGSKLSGFSWRRQPPSWPAVGESDALVLVEKADTRMSSAIHMLFVFFDLGVVWINKAGEVVDTVLARPWRLSYAPQAPARYVIEAHPAILNEVQIGDHVRFQKVTDERP